MADFEFDNELIEWRGPAPHYFVPVPASFCEAVREIARDVTYGWGMVPVAVRDRRQSVGDLAVAQGRRLPRTGPGLGSPGRGAGAGRLGRSRAQYRLPRALYPGPFRLRQAG